MSGARTETVTDVWPMSAATPGDRGEPGGRLRAIEWIWTVKGSVPLAPGQSGVDALRRLAPLFDEPGTRHETAGQTLSFTKKDQPAQDKLSVFDMGVLRVEPGPAGAVLRYRMVSRTLLFCFFLPLLFLGFAGLTLAVNYLQAPATGAAKPKPVAKKTPDVPMHPIDKALGAPAPEKKKPGKDDEDKTLKPTAAYVFAGLFALLYVIGRLLEARRVRTLFRKTVTGA